VDDNNSPTHFYKVVSVDTKTIQRDAYESEKFRKLRVMQYEVSRAGPQG